MVIKLIIFDFDGVLVDTQQVINKIEWQYFVQHGARMSLKTFTERFSCATAFIAEQLRKDGDTNLSKDNNVIAEEIDAIIFETLLKIRISPIKGVKDILQKLPFKKCIASNCSLRLLRAFVIASGLGIYFGDKVFSADEVKNPKPYPDLFLYAARQLGESPSQSLIIEDSEIGVRAAVSAGMKVVGFLGGNHITPSDHIKLIKAGAEQVFTDMKQLSKFLTNLQKENELSPLSEELPSPLEYGSERASMVKFQLEARRIHDPTVIRAMGSVPRHLFVPQQFQKLAYVDSPLPIGHYQTISQPYIVALICEAATLTHIDRVLDMGTGSGYQAAILSLLSKEVYSIELVKPLGEQAKELLHKLGYKNVHVKIGNGYEGWQKHAPYDAILIAAAAEKVPQALLNQLKLNGRLIMPIGTPFNQHLMRFTKIKDGFREENLGAVAFVPLKKEE